MGRKPYAKRKGLKVLKGGKNGTGAKRGRPPKTKGSGAHGPLGYSAAVKVKMDPECGLSEAGRLVVARHVEEFLQKQLKGVFETKLTHTTSHTIIASGQVRVTNWKLLDLRPAPDPQAKIPGTEKD